VKVIYLQNLVAKLEHDGLFALQALRRVRIDYIECDMTAFFTQWNKSGNVLRGIQNMLINGFTFCGRDVFVELKQVDTRSQLDLGLGHGASGCPMRHMNCTQRTQGRAHLLLG
jgi:hypothetical protein